MRPLHPFAAVLCLSGVLVALTGCGSGGGIVVIPPTPPTPITPETSACKTPTGRPASPATTSNYAGTAISVTVKAGALPVIGASVQLYAAGNTGNGVAPTSLLTSALTTDSNGAVSVPATFTCPYNLSTLYVVARGGKAGTTGATSSGTVLFSVLGTCSSITSGSSFVVNEATTVAGAYAMAQFLAAGGNMGASSTNFLGLSLAAATSANLVNPNTGVIGGAAFPATGTAPTGILASLSNLLNACIVSASGSSSACTQLYSATAVGTSVPSNTLDAMLNLVRHPAANVSTLFALTQASTAFNGALTAAPSDLTLFVTYAGGGMNAPSGLGIDSTGNVRVANYFSAVSAFSNTGVPVFPNGITGISHFSYGLAVDYRDNAWIPNEEAPTHVGSISIVNTAGASISNFSAGGINYPTAVSMATDGTAWIVDYGNSHITLTDNSGTPLSGTEGYTTNQFAFPVALAVDSKCWGFIANQSTNTITRVSPSGANFDSFVTGSGASGIAIDGSDNVWVANYYGNSIGLLSSAGTVISSGYTGGGVNHPQGIAVDGAGNVWVANYRAPGLTALAGATATVPGAALSPAAGFGVDAKLLEAFAIAIDPSGNVWVTNFGSNTITQFVGLAAPVRTPLLGPVSTP